MLAQTHAPLEVVVVDDGSTTVPPPAVEAALAGGGLTLLRQPRAQGASAARNLGVRASRGTWIAFLEEQDLWAPTHVATLLAGCEQRGSEFGYCASWVVDADRRIRGFRSVPTPDRLPRALLEANVIGTPSSIIVRRAFWQRAGGFDEWLGAAAPWDLWIRWSRHARLYMSSEPTVACTLDATPAGAETARELHELRRRYRGDAKAAGVRFGAAVGAELELAPAGASRPPWLAEPGAPTIPLPDSSG